MKKLKKIIKKIFRKIVSKKILLKMDIYHKLYRTNKKASIIKIMRRLFHIKLYSTEKKLFRKIDLVEYQKEEKFYYSIDVYKTIYRKNFKIGNLCIDYEKVLKNSLQDLKNKIKQNKKNEQFYLNEKQTIESIENLIDRTTYYLEEKNSKEAIIKNIRNIKNKKCTTFYEALQRILFFNQLLWQTYHGLNGLGRLDMILYPYYKQDIESGIISKIEARNLLREFLLQLHKFYELKSNMLLGDTGQIIILGGKAENGQYQDNELTYLFIELIKELQLPDPKLLVRVCSTTPRKIIEKSLECIQTGIGCPLFANDDVIIDKLINFGYQKSDAYTYTTSACWEPYIAGKSLDQNNLKSINFMKPFETLLKQEKLEQIKTKEELIKKYKEYLNKYINVFVKQIEKMKWQKDYILSLVMDECIENNLDIGEGGSLYNHYGFTGVGLSNLINSIMNIDELVFKNKEITFEKINEIRKENFKNQNQLLNRLKTQGKKYGTDDEEVIDITNDIIRYTTKIMNQYINPLGGKYKFGLSAPTYIEASKNFSASFDGRKQSEPFGVHISSDSSNSYTELIQFASKLDYGENRFNGNVVDFFVSPNFIQDNFEKFVDFLCFSIKVGFFEMQMNVVSSKTLIEARKNPEKFPNLIVRVWGFSAYFKDLPEEYKDYLIERALKSEI